MAKHVIRLDHWPYQRGEAAKLIKISKPYNVKGCWFVDALFLSVNNNMPKTIKRFFGDLHLLVIEAIYIDGTRQNMPNWIETNISITKNILKHKSIEPYLLENKRDHRFDCYTFGIKAYSTYYIIPLLEIMRAILAPDVFWLNQITQLDSIDTRVLHIMNNDVLELDFSSDVPTNYIKRNPAIKHMAWVFSNSEIYNMINLLHENIKKGEGIVFDFLFNELTITARFEERNRRKYIREIIACKCKKINCHDIQVTHPRLINYEGKNATSIEGKKSKRIALNMSIDGTKNLSSNMTAIPNVMDIEDDGTILSEYSKFVEINRLRTKEKRATSENAARSIFAIKQKRTTGEFGGPETVPQLEFEHMTRDNLNDDFSNIQAVLRLMKKRDEIESITQYIGTLNNHWRYRAICTLNDGITFRNYFVGKIKLKNGMEAIVIEIQRQHLKISTLMCISEHILHWDKTCHDILKNFIINSGTWPQPEETGDSPYLISYRFKHTNAEIEKKEKRIFEKINLT